MVPVVQGGRIFTQLCYDPKNLHTGALRRNRAVHDRRTRVKNFVKHANQWLGICISNNSTLGSGTTRGVIR